MSDNFDIFIDDLLTVRNVASRERSPRIDTLDATVPGRGKLVALAGGHE